jgi:hypothetical protein
MSENVEKTFTDEETGKFKPGNPGGGRPKGSLSFATKWRKFVAKVAESEGKTPEEIDEELYSVAMRKAKDGDYQFYRDIHDRVYGKPQQSVDVTTKGESMGQPSDEQVDKLAKEYESKLKEHFTNGTE